MAPTVLHLRAETKPLEHRSALTPTTAKALIDAGYEVHVEKGSGVKSGTTRIFDDAEFEKIGAKIVEEESWIDAPADHIIVGLKELREETFPLKHVHVQFAHCYKGQENWDQVLARFPRGGGTLLDLEFLADPKTGRRVAAFGYVIHCPAFGILVICEARLLILVVEQIPCRFRWSCACPAELGMAVDQPVRAPAQRFLIP